MAQPNEFVPISEQVFVAWLRNIGAKKQKFSKATQWRGGLSGIAVAIELLCPGRFGITVSCPKRLIMVQIIALQYLSILTQKQLLRKFPSYIRGNDGDSLSDRTTQFTIAPAANIKQSKFAHCNKVYAAGNPSIKLSEIKRLNCIPLGTHSFPDGGANWPNFVPAYKSISSAFHVFLVMPNFIINASPISGACKLADAGKQSAKKNLQLHNADLLSQAGDFISSVKHANTHKAAAAGKQHHRATTERTLGNAGSRTQSPLGNSAGVTCVGSPSPPGGIARKGTNRTTCTASLASTERSQTHLRTNWCLKYFEYYPEIVLVSVWSWSLLVILAFFSSLQREKPQIFSPPSSPNTERGDTLERFSIHERFRFVSICL